ncbi:MAG: hypothetical protein LIR50_05705 [Bacillota bacterium]|nr:hypothetical protein [Bacillota bacterium]
MYSTSNNYKLYINKPSRIFESKIIIGNRTFTNDDVIQIIPEVVQPNDGFSIGNTISQSLEITLRNDGGAYASVGVVNASIALNIEEFLEYVPLGIFNIDDVNKTDYTVKLTCYDNMIKFETPYASSLGNTPTLQQVVDELKNLTGVDYDITNWIIPNYTVTKLSGYTCREVLGYVASICGGNAYITRQGKFTVVVPREVDYTIETKSMINQGYKIEDQTYKIGMITCQNKNSDDNTGYDSSEDKNTISVGSLSADSMELAFTNSWVTESILTDIYNKLKNFSYLGYDLKWQGDLVLDAGDIITVIDKNNIARKTLVFANKLTYTGGLTAETSAKGETKNSNSFSSVGNNSQTINRLSVKILIAEQAIITKANIKDLEATNAKVETLDADIATINTALISYAKIDNLDATNARVTNLEVSSATVTQLTATNANVATLTTSVANINTALISKANVADLNATNATVSNLNTDLANVKTLVNGNLTSANIQSLVLTSSKVTVDNGFIKNAMIESLDVTKINAGTLNTNKISVSSSDGSLIIAGATQQFKDSDGKVRLQLGQDTTGDFNFILRSSDGTTTLIDGTGVHEKAIADKLIKTNMVADSAIGEQQINYSSFITGFNKDTNTNYIDSSKVAIDLTGQTLDIAFNNINAKVDGIKTTTETNTTSISAIQGQISTLISNTTITKDGTTTQLKDAYNSTVNTINSMQTTIGQHTTDIDVNTGDITSINSSVSSIQASLSSISASLSSTKSTVDNHTTQISTANTNITTALNNASSAVNTANTAKTTATTASTDASNAKTTANTASTNASTALTNSNTAISTANTASTNASSAVTTANKVSSDVATLNTTVTNTISRVSSLELTTTSLTTRIGNTETTLSNLSIGGRNLLRNSTGDFGTSYWQSGVVSENKYNFNSLKISNTATSELTRGSNRIILKPNTTYTISFYITSDSNLTSSDMFLLCRKINSTKDYDYSPAKLNMTPSTTGYDYVTWKYTTPSDIQDGYIRLDNNGTKASGTASNVWFSRIKVEEGTIPTDWTPAPEDIDNSIQSVKDYATTTINSNVSTINQTTDSIKADVSSLKSSVTTINTTLGNKADTTTVTNISNTVASLQTSISGINASITSLNSNVTTVTTTANNANTKIDNLQIGGRNLWLKTKEYDAVNDARWVDNNTGSRPSSGYSASGAWNGLGVIRITSAWADLSQRVTLETNTNYVLSAWIKSESDSALASLNAYANSDSKVTQQSFAQGQSISTTWTRYYFVFNSGSLTTSTCRFENGNSNAYLICGLKLEKGNKPTDYTVAPEDIDSSITGVNTTATNAINTANTATTNLANLTTTVSNVTNRVSSLELTTSGLTTTVSNVQTTINSLQVGGKNLLEQTADLTTVNGLGTWNIVKDTDGYSVLQINTTSTGWVECQIKLYSIINTLTGKLTLSFDYQSDTKNNLSVSLGIFSESGGRITEISNVIIDSVATFADIGNGWKRAIYIFNQTLTTDNETYHYRMQFKKTVNYTGSIKIKKPKLEIGNQATDWTPAPEDVDQAISDVQTYATTTINSAVSTINQTTDSIKANVTSLQSSVNTINTSLGNKAETSTVTAISNRTASLETSLTGINASITTINSNVSSVTTTANAAKSAIDGLQIGGRNLLNDSGFELGTITKSTVNSGTISITTEDKYYGNKSLKVVTSTSSTASGGCVICSNLVVGLKYTSTLWIKCTTGDSVNYRIMNSTWNTITSSSPTLVANTWTKLTLTFTATETSCKVGVLNGTAKAITFYLDCIKVELGNMPTDWTPAPEDTDTQISTINSSVSTLQSSVSVLQSQISLKVEQSNIDSAVSTINGQIATTNASISSMQSSINLQLDSITSKVSKISSSNLAVGGDFQTLNSTYWYIRPDGTDIFSLSLDTTNVFNSNNSLAITCTAIGGTSSKECTIRLNEQYALGTVYNITFYAKASTQMTVYFRAGYTTYPNGGNSVIIDTTWKQYSVNFTSHATNLDKYIYYYMSAVGTLYLNTVMVTGNVVGSIVSQSPTQVMTAFNNISQYFQVSADGAKFGDLASGDYTVMNDKGLQHYIGDTGYNYMYVTYVQDTTINVIGKTYKFGYNSDGTLKFQEDSYTIPYDDSLKKMLNGRVPKYVFLMVFKSITLPQIPSGWDDRSWTIFHSSFDSNSLASPSGNMHDVTCNSQGFTFQGFQVRYKLDDNISFNAVSGGTVRCRFLIFA